MRIIPVLSGKGGTGKTFVSINVANALKELRKKVGLVDIDITGPSALKYLGLHGKDVKVKNGILQPFEANGMQFISPALFFDSDDQPVLLRGKMRSKMVEQFLDKVQWNVDYLVLDCPPGSTDEINYLIRNRKKEIFGAIIVATPSDVAVTQVRKSLVLCQRLQIPILGIVENMYEFVCESCGAHQTLLSDGHDPVKTAAANFHVDIIAKIPFQKNVEANPLAFTPLLKLPLERLI